MLLPINPQNPQMRRLNEVADCLRGGGVIIYPTDTVYGLGCDITNKKAVERVCAIKQLDPRKAYLTFVCDSLKTASTYHGQIDTPLYKVMKRAFPGPYTFILPASKAVPRHFQTRKKTVGIRVVDHPIVMQLLTLLDAPLASISLDQNEDIQEYNTDPSLMYDAYQHQVDIVIDGGFGGLYPSTVIDATSGTPEVIREGAGDLEVLA